jgi:hypothetical protein
MSPTAYLLLSRTFCFRHLDASSGQQFELCAQRPLRRANLFIIRIELYARPRISGHLIPAKFIKSNCLNDTFLTIDL